jgi:hypothetical protein
MPQPTPQMPDVKTPFRRAAEERDRRNQSAPRARRGAGARGTFRPRNRRNDRARR